ncbi:hypothetical protein ASC61_10000 [Aeromicrobium sp. Root344]|uniref:hypothetical protein n=1 Tax=Aeromicrobium sp. Root344 TaxID=1736521 RepID=UPI0006F55304|nr:hypothetical protein [Aeromicrobium sp. Root344]KQV75305.1 hypothetical protein ASC61_10000 [Aeromicrobium sp. Root344]
MYEAYGLSVDSAIPLPLEPSTGLTADVEIRRGTVDCSDIRFAALDAGDDAWLEKGWGASRVVLRFVEMTVELSTRQPLITVDVTSTHDADHVAHLVLDHVVPQWLAMRGDLVLHAGAVQTPGGSAVAFVGESGRGKSTTTTGLAQLGWRFVADDACRVVSAGSSHEIVPSYPGVRLLAPSRAALVPELPSTPMADGATKHRVTPDIRSVTGPAPLSLVVELGSNAELAAHRMTLSESTACLARHSFYLAASQDAVATQTFLLASALAMDVPCVRVDFPRRWDVFPELAALIETTMP